MYVTQEMRLVPLTSVGLHLCFCINTCPEVSCLAGFWEINLSIQLLERDVVSLLGLLFVWFFPAENVSRLVCGVYCCIVSKRI